MKSLWSLNTTSENSWSHCRSYIYKINGSWTNGFLRKYTLFFPIEEALFWRFQVESILAWDGISWIILVINKCVLQISNLYYKVRCVSLCQHYNVRTLTSPPILKLWVTQGYLWLSYELTEVINLIEETFEPKKYILSKKYFISFLPNYCHSFRITVILSGLLSFLPDYCHSFQISVIPF